MKKKPQSVAAESIGKKSSGTSRKFLSKKNSSKGDDAQDNKTFSSHQDPSVISESKGTRKVDNSDERSQSHKNIEEMSKRDQDEYGFGGGLELEQELNNSKSKSRPQSKQQQSADHDPRARPFDERQGHEFDHIEYPPGYNHSKTINEATAHSGVLNNSSQKITNLKSNLQLLEEKVNQLRDTRQKKKNDHMDQQRRMNQELLGIVFKQKAQGPLKSKDIEPEVKEQVHHRPNSLTKENLKLKDENETLREKLAEQNREMQRQALELKEIRKSRDDALDRIDELARLLEGRQRADQDELREKNGKALEADQAVREERVDYF